MGSSQREPPLRVLLVEDNKHDLAAIERAFQRSDVETELTAVSRAEDALETLLADRSAFDLVATDHKLPGMTGLQLCQELVDRNLPLPVVLMTGAGSEALAIEALKLGVDDYLIKDHERRNLGLFPAVLEQVVGNYRTSVAKKRAEAALARESGINAAVAELSKALLSPGTLDEMSDLVLRQARDFTESTLGFVGHYDSKVGRFLSGSVSGSTDSSSQPVEMTQLPLDEEGGLLGWAMRERRAVVSNDVGALADRCILPDSHPELRSFLAAPAMIGETLVGQVALANAPRPYTDEDLKLVERFASLYALAVRHQLAQDELHHAKDELEERVKLRTAELSKKNEQLQAEISERRQAETAKADAEQELEKHRTMQIRSDRIRALGEMAAGIAHELSQPLVGVRGMSEDLLLSTQRGLTIEKDELQEMLSSIIQQADRMTHVIQHIRAFCREADRTEREEVDANEVAQTALGLIGAQYRARGLELESDFAPELPPFSANPYALEEVVINLLLNARDALETTGPVGGVPPRAILKTSCTTSDGDEMVHIEVVDEGTGIAEDVLPQVFEPFFTTKEPGRAMGLGLSVSRTIVENFGGEISIENRKDGGARATISFLALRPEDR